MTSKLIIEISAQEDLKFWHQKLDGYYYNYQHWVPRVGTTVRPHIELGKLYFMGSGGNFNYEAAITILKKH